MPQQTPIRNGHGQIVDLIDTKLLIDTTEDATPPLAPVAPPATQPRPQRPQTAPTPLGQLRPQAAPAQAAPARGQGWLIVVAVIALIGLAVLALRGEGSAAPPFAPSASAPSASPPAPTVPELVRAIVAYDAPGGDALGALEAGRAYSVVASSDGWQQLQLAESGLVWVRAWELAGELQPSATVTPEPTATLHVPPRPAPVQRPVYVPPPTPAWDTLPVVGRAESPDGVLICESRISQADAERCLGELLAQTSTP